MTKNYFMDGKKIDLDSSEWILIYSDGRWSSRGFNVFWRKKDDKFIVENWSNWQKEVNTINLYNRKQIIAYLIDERHPERVAEAFEIIGYKPEMY